ncbi:MAG: ribonuclease III [Candidatus Hydrogenedentes bacterium]|nr:ribonuclease III [Candidatus Hydrogenedentota bacterium]
MPAEDSRSAELRLLAARLGVDFKNIALFDRALTHASLVAESGTPLQDFESLEFLGDAVLGLAAAHHLFEVLPDRRPGEYSKMRAGLVNRRCVARVGRVLDIVPHIRLGKGEEQSGGRNRTALVSDCMEAIIGAIYLDRGWQVAQDFVVRVFQEEFSRNEWKSTSWDYKSRLQNYCQSQRIALPLFRVVRSDGPDHKKEFEVEVLIEGEARGRGAGSTKKEAEQQAAREALTREGQYFD